MDTTDLWWSVHSGRHVRLSCRFRPQQGLCSRSADACTFLQMRKELSTGDEDWAESMHAFLANWGADAVVQGVVTNVNSHWLRTFFDCFCARARDLWPTTNCTLAFLFGVNITACRRISETVVDHIMLLIFSLWRFFLFVYFIIEMKPSRNKVEILTI